MRLDLTESGVSGYGVLAFSLELAIFEEFMLKVDFRFNEDCCFDLSDKILDSFFVIIYSAKVPCR